MLFRLLIYVKNIKNRTYIASTKKKPGYPHFFKKKTTTTTTTGDIVSRGQKYFSTEQGVQGFGHLGKPFDSQLIVCVWDNYFVATTAQRAKYSIRYRLIERQKKTRKRLMPEGTNSRCPLKVSKLTG